MKLELRTNPLRQVRAEEKVPGVIYGRKIAPKPIQVDYKEIMKMYREYGTSMTFHVNLDGEEHQVYIKELQINPIKRNDIIHFDLQKVTAEDTISADIAIVLNGKDPVEARGLIVQVVAQTVLAEYSPGAGVTSFQIDVSGLDEGDVLRVKDIELPEGIKLVDDPEKMIVNVTVPTMEEEPAETDEDDLEGEEAADDDVEVEAIKQKDEE